MAEAAAVNKPEVLGLAGLILAVSVLVSHLLVRFDDAVPVTVLASVLLVRLAFLWWSFGRGGQP